MSYGWIFEKLTFSWPGFWPGRFFWEAVSPEPVISDTDRLEDVAGTVLACRFALECCVDMS